MDVDIDDGTRERDKIINFLTDIEEICFKSQQRGEADLTKTQKADIGVDIFNKSKLNFLTRFGKFLQRDHLEFFKKFTESGDESCEIDIVLKDLISINRNQAKNRRFEALKELVEGDSYFSEIEMMKRNPLLYDQLVGQYLSEEDKKERDRLGDASSLVTVLMEGIERDDAEAKRKEQEGCEANDDSEESSDEDMDNPAPVYSRWGEFEEDQKVIVRTKKCEKKNISEEEQVLLKEEFVSSMYQSFLDGKDNFDYSSVDNNEKYDNVGMEQCDVEDKYFDSEEPEPAPAVEIESEDEFDIFMGALNQNPAVKSITKDIEKL